MTASRGSTAVLPHEILDMHDHRFRVQLGETQIFRDAVFVSATNEFALACIDGLIGPATERQIVPPAVLHTYYGRSHVDDAGRLSASQT